MTLRLFALLISFFLQFANLSSQNINLTRMYKTTQYNSVTFDLASAKLCRDYLSKVDVKEDRKNQSSFTSKTNYSDYGCHICTEMIKKPYESPLENFLNIYMNDNRIVQNMRNPFSLKQIRSEYNEKYLDEYNSLLDSIDTDNLSYYQNYVNVDNYLFDEKLLIVKVRLPSIGKVYTTNYSNKATLTPVAMSIDNNILGKITEDKNIISNIDLALVKLPMDEKTAQKYFDKTEGRARLYAKIYYGLEIGEELNGKPRYFQVVFKKVEFFSGGKKKNNFDIIPENFKEENKVFDLIFEKNLYYAKNKYQYQKVKLANY